jgi:hypothetical protein
MIVSTHTRLHLHCLLSFPLSLFAVFVAPLTTAFYLWRWLQATTTSSKLTHQNSLSKVWTTSSLFSKQMASLLPPLPLPPLPPPQPLRRPLTPKPLPPPNSDSACSSPFYLFSVSFVPFLLFRPSLFRLSPVILNLKPLIKSPQFSSLHSFFSLPLCLVAARHRARRAMEAAAQHALSHCFERWMRYVLIQLHVQPQASFCEVQPVLRRCVTGCE